MKINFKPVREESEWKPYIDWLPQLGTLENLPHNWVEDKNDLKNLIGLGEQVEGLGYKKVS